MYEIINQEVSMDRDYIWNLEKRTLRENSEFIYNPSIYFGGSYSECFSNLKI